MRRAFALAVAILLIPGAAFPQVASAPERGEQLQSVSSGAEYPERLLRTFELLKQPGFQPELVELLGLDAELARAAAVARLGATPAAAGVSTYTWTWIGIGIAVAVFIYFLAKCDEDSC